MIKEKQIDEMARVYNDARLKASETLGSMNKGEAWWYSEALYNAGYRKQSAVIDEFAERVKKHLNENPSIFTQQRYIVATEIDNLVEEMKGGAE